MALALTTASTAFAGAPVGAPRPVAMMAKSKAMPFLEQPAALTGQYAGDAGFDPLGFSENPHIPLPWMREAEIKHGRVAMLAIVGWCTVDLGFRAPYAPAMPGFHSADVVSAMDGPVGWGIWQLIGWAGIFEIAGAAGIVATLNGDREPGDFALTLGFGKKPEQMARLKVRMQSEKSPPLPPPEPERARSHARPPSHTRSKRRSSTAASQ